MKKLGLGLFVVGTVLLLWSGYSWEAQSSAITHEPALIQEKHSGWNETNAQKTIRSSEKDRKSIQHEYGHNVGELEIPRIGNVYDVFYGTDSNTLKKGVGLHESKWTVMPDQSGHVVLSGHRDTVFSNLDELKKGDHLYVTYQGTIYDYQIRNSWVTDEDDRTVIVSKEKPTLTLTTCYPFSYVGPAPQRYILQAELVFKEAVPND